jgi:hypothetical protein
MYMYVYPHTHTHTHMYIYADNFRCLDVHDLYSNYTGHKSCTSKHLKLSALYIAVVIIYLWWTVPFTVDKVKF